MPSRSSRFLELALLVLLFVWPSAARAQACCAGSGALTPGRLAIHEKALVGAQVKLGHVLGSLDGAGHYSSNPSGAGELDLEQDVFGSLRVLQRGQVSLLVPFVETHRSAPGTGSEFGGGIGDLNASVRWDFINAGENEILPGIGLLAGVTFPTGTAPESASKRLATDSTGVGAFQGNIGLALEQIYGSWLVNATILAADRLPRTANGIRTSLGVQFTTLAAVAYTLPDDSALAFVASYTFEGDATIEGKKADDSGRRLLRLSIAGAHPFSDVLKLQGSLYFDPPIPHVDQNQTTSIGFTLALLRSWS